MSGASRGSGLVHSRYVHGTRSSSGPASPPRPATGEALEAWPATLARIKPRKPALVDTYLAPFAVSLQDEAVVVQVNKRYTSVALKDAQLRDMLQGLVGHAIRFEDV